MNKLFLKLVVGTLLIIIGMYLSFIVFNHVSSWLGILIALTVIVGGVYFVITKVEKALDNMDQESLDQED